MNNTSPQRVAIVGAGISGLVTAHLLHGDNAITVFEEDHRIGGHANTTTVHEVGQDVAIDTGFIVYNDRNYPRFTELLAALGVATQPSEMSFSVTSAVSGLEYGTTGVNTLLARRTNLFRPSFIHMLAEIPRFNREARALLESSDVSVSIGDFLTEGRFSRAFIDDYLIPLGASIWSADPQRFLDFPAADLARFLSRHGLLSLRDRPVWRTVTGGSQSYVRALARPFTHRIRTRCRVHRIDRDQAGVVVHSSATPDGERFDRVVLATHADVSLALLSSPTPAEAAVLGALRFQRNRATLHTDSALLPRRRRAWASWNYRRTAVEQNVPVLTYYANRLQRIASTSDYCITLNADALIDPRRVIASYEYSHPVFDAAALLAQRRHPEIDGRLNTHYVGAYWGYGFHEDGVESAIGAVRRLRRGTPGRVPAGSGR